MLVKTYARLLREYKSQLDSPVYAVPSRYSVGNEVELEYRGIDREPLAAWPPEMLGMTQEELGSAEKPPPGEERAILAMYELEREARLSENDLFLTRSDALRVLSLLDSPAEREIIWVSESSIAGEGPECVTIMGYEPAWIAGNHFSPLCDTMFFPRWHGTDLEGKLFAKHYHVLNRNGLFESPDDATEFLKFYCTLDWAEKNGFVIAAIAAPKMP